MTEFLLSHPRIKMDVKTYEGHTPLRLAQGRKHMHIVQLLMLAGADEDEEEDESFESSSGDDEEAMNCDVSSTPILPDSRHCKGLFVKSRGRFTKGLSALFWYTLYREKSPKPFVKRRPGIQAEHV
jgi:hypothetical protein